jgi:hypothetical protein
MLEPIDPQVSDKPASPLMDQMELVKFLREQAEANRSALREEAIANRSAQREESAEIRKLFTVTSSIVAAPLVAALALAGIFWFRDMNTMKEAMKQEGEAAAKLEIQKMDSHIDDTLQAQFSTKSMQDRIDRAAEAATEGKAKNLIEDRVQRLIGPIKSKAEASIKAIHIQELELEVKNGNARAYDELRSLTTTGSPDEKRLVKLAMPEFATSAPIPPSMEIGCVEPNSAKFKELIASQIAEIRMQVLHSCDAQLAPLQLNLTRPGQSPPRTRLVRQFVPTLFILATDDPSLPIRDRALGMLNSFFLGLPGYSSNGYGRLEVPAIQQWWRAHETDYEALALLAYANDNKVNTDSTYLYDLLKPFEGYRSPDLSQQFRQIREQMRSEAIQINGAPIDISIEHVEVTCKTVEEAHEYEIAHPDREDTPDELRHHSNLEPLKFIKSCPLNASLLKPLVDDVLNTHHLSTRFAAITVINKWKDTKFDPFDGVSLLRDWWKNESGAPPK